MYWLNRINFIGDCNTRPPDAADLELPQVVLLTQTLLAHDTQALVSSHEVNLATTRRGPDEGVAVKKRT